MKGRSARAERYSVTASGLRRNLDLKCIDIRTKRSDPPRPHRGDDRILLELSDVRRRHIDALAHGWVTPHLRDHSDLSCFSGDSASTRACEIFGCRGRASDSLTPSSSSWSFSPCRKPVNTISMSFPDISII